MIEVKDITLSYTGHERELGNVGFTVARGEFASLVGPSGCGKSSLLRIVAGVLRPLSGEVRLDGELVAGRRAGIGFVPQDALLLPWRKVLANVSLPLELAGVHRKAAEAEAARLLEIVGMSWAAGKYPATLSGGERQRIAIARALAGNPRFLLLDEPFGALDAITREELNLTLQDIWLRARITVLFVTHSIAEAVFLSDRVLIMGEKPGRILGEVRVGLPRPRRLEDLCSQELSALAARARRILAEGGGLVA